VSASLSHLREDGTLTMVDVGAKAESARSARALAVVRFAPAAAAALRGAAPAKGDAFAAARLAGIMAAKQAANLIPLAHSVPLAHVAVELRWLDGERVAVEASARTVARTGVELEALTAAAIAALTLYDMTKALGKGSVVQEVRLLEKRGGKSGDWFGDP
jgi:cyclic pyranopterin phosphate synthase